MPKSIKILVQPRYKVVVGRSKTLVKDQDKRDTNDFHLKCSQVDEKGLSESSFGIWSNWSFFISGFSL